MKLYKNDVEFCSVSTTLDNGTKPAPMFQVGQLTPLKAPRQLSLIVWCEKEPPLGLNNSYSLQEGEINLKIEIHSINKVVIQTEGGSEVTHYEVHAMTAPF